MADLNALIAQGPQFHMPDPLGQYAKMQQLQAGQQQMRTGALQEQTAGMQLQQLKQDRDNMAKLSQQLSAKGIGPRQYFEALQSSGDAKYQQLGIEGLMKLDATEAFDRSQQTIPGQTPARVGGELGSGTAFMDNALPGMPAPVNALATRAAAPAASTNALAPTPAAADPAVTAIEAEMRRIQPFVSSGATGAKEAMARLEKKLEIASKRYTVGDTLMGQSGNVFGTAPAKAAASVLPLPADVEAQRIRMAIAGRTPRAEATPAAPVAVVDPVTGKTVFVSREEALRGRMSPAGAKPAELKQVPVHAQKAIVGASTAIKKIDDAIAALDSGTEEATGIKGYLPDMALNRMYPEGTEARAAVADIGSLVMHERSGAAVTASESPRLKPFIPLITDDKTTALKKLRRMRQIQTDDAEALAGTYNPEQGFREFKVATPAAAPAGVDAALWNVMTPEEKKLWQK